MAFTPLRFRPHHFLCALGFRGKGYSDAFTANMAQIVVGTLRTPGGGQTEIEVTGSTDDICTPCPRRRGALCTSQDKIDRLDARHAAALTVQPGDRLSWDEAQARIRARVAPGDLTRLCADCDWLPLGLCEKALSDLHEG